MFFVFLLFKIYEKEDLFGIILYIFRSFFFFFPLKLVCYIIVFVFKINKLFKII